jgi:hypothetical protein
VESEVINVSVRQVGREKITRGWQSRSHYPSRTLALDRVGLKQTVPLGRAKRADLFRSDAFIEKHTASNKDLKENPLVQLRATKPSLGRIFAKSGKRAIAEAYDHGYRLHEIAAHSRVRWNGEPQTQTDRANELKQCGTVRTHPRLVILLLRDVQNSLGSYVLFLVLSENCVESGKPWLNQGIHWPDHAVPNSRFDRCAAFRTLQRA